MIMKIYRYKTIKTKIQLNESKLNEFGRRGFELCGTVEDDHGYTYYFKIEQENQ